MPTGLSKPHKLKDRINGSSEENRVPLWERVCVCVYIFKRNIYFCYTGLLYNIIYNVKYVQYVNG